MPTSFFVGSDFILCCIDTKCKPDVLNPLSLRNTVGAELVDIFEAHNITDYESRLGVKGLKSKERLTKKVMRKAAEILNIPGVDVVRLLTDFQRAYLEEKPHYVASYNKEKAIFDKLKWILPMVAPNADELDKLGDIMKFLGADDLDEALVKAEALRAQQALP